VILYVLNAGSVTSRYIDHKVDLNKVKENQQQALPNSYTGDHFVETKNTYTSPQWSVRRVHEKYEGVG